LSMADSWYMGTCGTECYMQVFHVWMTSDVTWIECKAGRSYENLGCDWSIYGLFPLRESLIWVGICVFTGGLAFLLLEDVPMTRGMTGKRPKCVSGTVPTVGYRPVHFYMERVQAVSFSTRSTLVLSSTVWLRRRVLWLRRRQ